MDLQVEHSFRKSPECDIYAPQNVIELNSLENLSKSGSRFYGRSENGRSMQAKNQILTAAKCIYADSGTIILYV